MTAGEEVYLWSECFFSLINLIRITESVLKYCIWLTKHQLRIKMSRNHKMTRYDTGNPLWYCFLFPIFPMMLLLGLWCYFGWMHEKLVRCGATKARGFWAKEIFCISPNSRVVHGRDRWTRVSVVYPRHVHVRDFLKKSCPCPRDLESIRIIVSHNLKPY